MKILNHKIFRSIIFVLLINFENIFNDLYPSFLTVIIQFISILIFYFYFLPISIQKSEITNFVLLKYKILLVLFVVLLLNLEHIILLKTLEIKSFILSIILAVILIYVLLPNWYKNDNINK